MAFDISIGEKLPEQAPLSFEEFYDTNAAELGRALALCAQDVDTARVTLALSLAATAQRWKQISRHPFAPGWTYAQGLENIEAKLGRQPGAHHDEATGGYVRGLDLASAISALPLMQRASLVATHFLGWSDEQLSAGLAVPQATVRTRYRRAIAFLVHHQNEDSDAIKSAVTAHFAELAANVSAQAPEVTKVERMGRRTRIRNRLLAGAAVLMLIAVGGMIFRVSRRPPPAPEVVEPADPPNASSDWFAPISDGRGGFVALNSRGASDFSTSVDGVDWFPANTWNSRGIDLRTEISSFQRSGGRYVVSIEPISALESDVPPRIASSDDLKNWNVQVLANFAPGNSQADVVPIAEVLSVAATPTDILVAVGSNEVLDYESLDIFPGDVCVESAQGPRFVLHLCDGTTIETPQAADDVQTRFLLSQTGAPFTQVDLPDDADPYSLFSFGSYFGVQSLLDGGVSTSVDGKEWNLVLVSTGDQQRLSLGSGAASGEWVVVIPGSDRWVSHVFRNDVAIAVPGPLPIDLDPQSVWIKPQLVHGPAGWALFVTTSRPWEQTDASRGWAIDDGEWIVVRAPNSDIISARLVDGERSLRYQVSSEFVTIDSSGSVSLRDPASGELAVEITSEQIAETWQADGQGADVVRARVLFSPNGVDWEPIWESTTNTWLASIAVGDNEVVLTGASAVGAPIRIPLDE